MAPTESQGPLGAAGGYYYKGCVSVEWVLPQGNRNYYSQFPFPPPCRQTSECHLLFANIFIAAIHIPNVENLLTLTMNSALETENFRFLILKL